MNDVFPFIGTQLLSTQTLIEFQDMQNKNNSKERRREQELCAEKELNDETIHQKTSLNGQDIYMIHA